MHCDAYVIGTRGVEYLVIDWREGGKRRVALDAWLLEADGLTPIWDGEGIAGEPVYWGERNDAIMSRVHARVLLQTAAMMHLGRGRWTRVSVLAHYVRVTETDVETMPNTWAKPKAYGPRTRPPENKLPDWL